MLSMSRFPLVSRTIVATNTSSYQFCLFSHTQKPEAALIAKTPAMLMFFATYRKASVYMSWNVQKTLVVMLTPVGGRISEQYSHLSHCGNPEFVRRRTEGGGVTNDQYAGKDWDERWPEGGGEGDQRAGRDQSNSPQKKQDSSAAAYPG